MVIKMLINSISDGPWDKLSLGLLEKTTNKGMTCIKDDLQFVLSSCECAIQNLLDNPWFYLRIHSRFTYGDRHAEL